MNIAAATFAELSPAQVEFNNLLLTKQLRLMVEAEIGLLTISDLKQVNSLPVNALAMELKLADNTRAAYLAQGDAQLLLQQYFDEIDLTILPPMLLEAGVEKILAGFQAALKAQFGSWLELIKANMVKELLAPAKDWVLVAVTVQFATLSMPLYLRLTQQDVTQLLGRYGTSVEAANGDLVLPVSLSFGKTRLQPEELADLQAGDVVFFDTCYYQHAQQLRLDLAPHQAWLTQLAQHTISVIQPWNSNMETPSHSANANPADAEATSVDVNNLAMDVQFEMAPQSLPLSQIKAIAPGFTFDLQADPAQAIHIKVNGQTLGLGELVSIGGKLGVRVTTLNKG